MTEPREITFTGSESTLHALAEDEPGKIIWANGDEVTAAELQNALVAFRVGLRVQHEEDVKTVEGQMEAFLPSPGLNPAWIAGWHAAVRHAVLALKRSQP